MPAPTQSTEVKRRVWHYVPYRPKIGDEVIAAVPSAMKAIAPWIAAARDGRKRSAPTTTITHYSESLGIPPKSQSEPKTDHDFECELAAALTLAIEWDGFMICQELYGRGWPLDAELVQLLHRWSCDYKGKKISEWKAKSKKGNRA